MALRVVSVNNLIFRNLMVSAIFYEEEKLAEPWMFFDKKLILISLELKTKFVQLLYLSSAVGLQTVRNVQKIT